MSPFDICLVEVQEYPKSHRAFGFHFINTVLAPIHLLALIGDFGAVPSLASEAD